MKKLLYTLLGAVLMIGGTAFAATTVFKSNQLAPTPTNGKILQTDGTNSSWVTNTSSGGSGTVGTSTVPTLGNLSYWTSAGTPSLLGSVATTTITAGSGMSFTTFTAIGSSPITLNATGVASNALGTTSPWTVGQVAYVNGQGTVTSAATTTLTGTAPIVFSNPISVIGATPSVVTCATATGSVPGCLSAADWMTFNNKTSNTGTVTSVGLSSTNSTLTIGSTPVTTTGTITADLNLGNINTWSAVQNFGAGLVSSASSTITGNTNGTNLLFVNATATSSPSISVGGLVHIDMKSFDGTGLLVVASSSASNNGRLVSLINTSYLNPQNLILASSTAANSTTANFKGWPTGQGVVKIEHTGSGTGFSNASGVSIDNSTNDSQGVFIKQNNTGKSIHVTDPSSNDTFSVSGLGAVTAQSYTATSSDPAKNSSFQYASTTKLSINNIAQYAYKTPGFTYATSTAWTATTTALQLPSSFTNQTINAVQCYTDAGTLNVDIYHTSTHLTLFNASTTQGTVSFSTNNTMTAGEKWYVTAGTPATSPTSITCTFQITPTGI